jgi:tetratricopeptide (TPR) repeat protein
MPFSALTEPGADYRELEPLPKTRSSRRRRRPLIVTVLAALLLAAAVAAGLDDARRDTPAGTPQPVPDRLAATIAQAQDRLRRVPGDADTWAALGSAYVEQARVSGNPAYYGQAQGALDRSTQLRPAGNAAAAIGLGALANARHDFAAARTHAEQALAFNPFSMEANGVLADAATRLGDTATATAAVQRMLDLRPGVAAFTRASYELELHGRVDEARLALERAEAVAIGRDELAFCQYYLSELAWGRWRPGGGARPLRARAGRCPGRSGAAAGPGEGARRHGTGRRGDHRLRPAGPAGAVAAVPPGIR